METDPWKEDLDELVERYLDGTLSPGAAAELEARIEDDQVARDALISALTARGLAELANSSGRDAGVLLAAPSAACEQARRSMPTYRTGSLSQGEMGPFVRHLDDCVACQAFYEVTADAAPAPPPRRSRKVAATLALLLANTVILLVVLFSSSPDAIPAGLQDGVLPVLPVSGENLTEIVGLVRMHSTQSDSTSIDLALRQIEDHDPEFLARARNHPGIRALLAKEELSNHVPRLVDEIVFLLVYLYEPRLAPQAKKEALRPLAHRLNSPRRILWTVIGESRDPELLHVALGQLMELGLRPEDSRRTRQLFDRAMDCGDTNTISTTLEALADVEHPDTPGLCLGILQGHYGLFVNKSFPRAAAPLLRFAKSAPDELAKRALHALATGTGPSVGRAVALEALGIISPSPLWHEAMLGLAGDKDPRARRLVARHLRRTGDRDSLEILDELCKDEDLETSYIAKQARRALGSR